MKIRAFTFSWLLIAFMFAAAGSPAVLATTESPVNEGIGFAFFDNSTRDFSVDINFVGETTLPGGLLPSGGTEGGMDVYNYNTSTAVPIVNVKFNYSGLITVNGSDAAGQVFVVANNFLKMATSRGEHTTTGFAVPLTQGDNFVSVVYIAADEDGNYHYAIDTVIVRVRADGDFTNKPTYDDGLVYFDVEDEFTAGSDYPLPDPDFDYNDPVTDLDFHNYDGEELDGSSQATAYVQTVGLNVTGSVNSTGTVALEPDFLNGTDAVKGKLFYVDDYGVHDFPANFNFTGGSLNATFKTYDTIADGEIGGDSFLGLLTFSPNGIYAGDGEKSDADATYFSEFGATLDGANFLIVTGNVSTVTVGGDDTPINIFAVGFGLFSSAVATYFIRRRKK